MTKFEEELNKKMDLKEVPMYFTQSGCSITRKTYIETNWIFDNYKNWHSDEEFQELLSKYSVLNDNYEKEVVRSSKLETSNLKLISEGNGLLSDNATLTKEIANLKSQLQQQALPVVPECVAEFIVRYKGRRTIYGAFDKISKNQKSYPKLYEWVFEDENSQATFALAFITGKYEVEKTKMIVSPCPVCGYEDVKSNFCSICGRKNDYE